MNQVVEPDVSDEEMRPIAVHVKQIIYDVDLRHTYRKRIAVVDLEYSKEQIADMIKNLQKRLDATNERGSIRIRFKGSMVLE